MENKTDEEHLDNTANAYKDTGPINPNQEPENMEVHHHPNLHHKRKHLKEYFLEFLMIFLAVTMGFFAENMRETISDHQREKQYMKSMLQDLEKDTTELRFELDFSVYIANGLDSLRAVMYGDLRNTDVVDIYRLHAIYSRKVNLFFSDQTSSQLKAGGMQFVRNRKVANSISEYWSMIEALKGVLDNYSGKGANASEMASGIFNYKYVHIFQVDNGKRVTMQIDPKALLITRDNTLLVNYANHLFYMISILRNIYLADLKKQKMLATNLLALIKKEYALDDE
jgi:hypothetical protein